MKLANPHDYAVTYDAYNGGRTWWIEGTGGRVPGGPWRDRDAAEAALTVMLAEAGTAKTDAAYLEPGDVVTNARTGQVFTVRRVAVPYGGPRCLFVEFADPIPAEPLPEAIVKAARGADAAAIKARPQRLRMVRAAAVDQLNRDRFTVAEEESEAAA
ncbi:hypothetical protein [Agromyces sp. NPDC058104]|uniref:hypothetical protein n=1 Tax=Agromyces sp. NPDC058104 TaxID=3346342 RepID=UPI0036DB3031